MSPRSIITFSPSTAVKPREPSMMKRNANGMCRCARAVSPGRMVCKPA
jgi:hypothetical protein